MGISSAMGPDALQPGLVLVKSQTVGTAVSTVVVADAFSSTYVNYRVLLSGIQPTATDSFRLMLGTGATNSHYGSMYYDLFTGGGTGTLRVNNGPSIYIALTEGATTTAQASFDIQGPNAARSTAVHGTWFGRGYAGWFSGFNSTNTQFTSFTLLTDGAGTMTGGTISVYGYRN